MVAGRLLSSVLIGGVVPRPDSKMSTPDGVMWTIVFFSWSEELQTSPSVLSSGNSKSAPYRQNLSALRRTPASASTRPYSRALQPFSVRLLT